MNNNPLHPALRLTVSGALSFAALVVFDLARHDPLWLVGLGGVAGLAFVLLIPVMVRGNSWQKMLAGLLLFVPCFGLLMAVMGVASSL